MPINAVKNYCHRLLKGDKRSAMVFAITLIIICVIGSGFGQILLKIGISQVDGVKNFQDFLKPEVLLRILTNPYVIAAFACYVLLVILWLGALSNLNVSFLFPLSSLAYLVAALAAWLLLKETITAMHWVGIAFIVCGCLFISLSKA